MSHDSTARDLEDVRASRRRLVTAADADRRALEGALHDGVQQDLIALAVDLQRLHGLLETDPVAAQALLDEMGRNVRSAMNDATELAERIHPPLLDARGLAGALRSAAARAGVTIAIDASVGADQPPEITAALYWSCVEALSSASPGSEATVTVDVADGVMTFDVTIDGHPSEDRLTNLRDRLEAMDGGLTVDDASGGGTHLQGWLPASR